MSLNLTRSSELFKNAQSMIPGGVNSPVRSFASVGGHPFVASRGEGAHIYDVDGNQYIDLVGSWGPLIHGHNHPKVIEFVKNTLDKALSFGVSCEVEYQLCAKVREFVPSVEMIRLVNSGTEACLSAARLARAYTKRDYLVKFDGHYHGHGDSFLVAAGSGLATLGVSSSGGVPESVSEKTIVIPFNNIEVLELCFEKHGSKIAGVMMEVVTGNMGVVLPDMKFLSKLRELCTKHSSVLIFDEVMTGFRLSKAGSQGIYQIQPDLSCFGKVIGGGMPVGAYGGKREIMKTVAPLGPMYQAGTLSGNPVACSAGLATLNLIDEDPNLFYQSLDHIGSEWASRLRSHIQHKSYPVSVEQIGSMLTVFFCPQKPTNFSEAKAADLNAFSRFFRALLERGVYYPPSQFESCFLSVAHSDEVMERVAEASLSALDEVFS